VVGGRGVGIQSNDSGYIIGMKSNITSMFNFLNMNIGLVTIVEHRYHMAIYVLEIHVVVVSTVVIYQAVIYSIDEKWHLYNGKFNLNVVHVRCK
jgi:fumarate reductase subunit D